MQDQSHPEWIVFFPMVKAAIKSLDTIADYAEKVQPLRSRVRCAARRRSASWSFTSVSRPAFPPADPWHAHHQVPRRRRFQAWLDHVACWRCRPAHHLHRPHRYGHAQLHGRRAAHVPRLRRLDVRVRGSSADPQHALPAPPPTSAHPSPEQPSRTTRVTCRRPPSLRPQLQDYWNCNITQDLNTPEMAALSRIVDPLQYKANLTMPKLVIDATGDEFFMPGAWGHCSPCARTQLHACGGPYPATPCSLTRFMLCLVATADAAPPPPLPPPGSACRRRLVLVGRTGGRDLPSDRAQRRAQ